MTSGPQTFADPTFKAAVMDEICDRLADGQSLAKICADDKMPAWGTIHNWMDADDEFSGRIMRAREAGYMHRADKAVMDAQTADDAGLGRLAFDAERWYLGKLSNAFGDNKEKAVKVTHDLPAETAAWLGMKS